MDFCHVFNGIRTHFFQCRCTHLIQICTKCFIHFAGKRIFFDGVFKGDYSLAIARKLGYKLVDHRLELYGVPIEE